MARKRLSQAGGSFISDAHDLASLSAALREPRLRSLVVAASVLLHFPLLCYGFFQLLVSREAGAYPGSDSGAVTGSVACAALLLALQLVQICDTLLTVSSMSRFLSKRRLIKAGDGDPLDRRDAVDSRTENPAGVSGSGASAGSQLSGEANLAASPSESYNSSAAVPGLSDAPAFSHSRSASVTRMAGGAPIGAATHTAGAALPGPAESGAGEPPALDDTVDAGAASASSTSIQSSHDHPMRIAVNPVARALQVLGAAQDSSVSFDSVFAAIQRTCATPEARRLVIMFRAHFHENRHLLPALATAVQQPALPPAWQQLLLSLERQLTEVSRPATAQHPRSSGAGRGSGGSSDGNSDRDSYGHSDVSEPDSYLQREAARQREGAPNGPDWA